MNRVRLGASVATVVAVILGAALAAQQPRQRPTFRSRVDLVQIDVVAVDADGQPVRGLTSDDFEVFDGTELQPIATFKEIAHERPAADVLPVTLKRDVADNATSRSDRLIVIVLDDLNFREKTDEVKAMALRVVRELGPGASLALVTTSGSFGVEPTEDRALILTEIENFMDKFDPQGRRVHPAVASGLRMPVMSGPAVGGRADPGDLARFFAPMTQYRTLQDVATKIGGTDGRRKAFVWISGGSEAPASAPRHRDTTIGEDMHLSAQAGLLEALRMSNVTAYSIHTGDFGPAVLRKVADASGGFVMKAENFENDIGRLVADLDHYYLLGFYPADADGPAYRPIEVRAKRSGVALRYRRGYQTAPQPARSRNKAPLARLAEGIFPSGDLPLRLAAAVLPRAGRSEAQLAITLEVQSDRAPLVESDGQLRDVLKYSIWAVDLKKKKVARSVAREVTFSLASESVTPSDRMRYQVQAVMALPPGRYQLRASAMSVKLNHGGSVYLETIVPNVVTNGLALSGLVLGLPAQSSVPVVGNRVSRDVLPFDPTLNRAFTTEDTLRVFCDVIKPARTGVDVVVDLLDRADNVVRVLEKRHLTPLTGSRFDVNLPLAELAPGGYRVRVRATNGEISVDGEVGIVISSASASHARYPSRRAPAARSR